MNNQTFVTKQFHLWPFYGFKWRGFLPTYSIDVSSEDINFSINGRTFKSVNIEDVCLAHFVKTWFGYGKIKLRFATRNDSYQDNDEERHFLSKYVCYLNPNSLDQAILSFKEANVKCFRPESVTLKNGRMWMCGDKVINYQRGFFERYYCALNTSGLKYFYTQKSLIPFMNPVLITGARSNLRIRFLRNNDINKLKQNVIANGAKLGDVSNSSFEDTFSMKVIFSPSLWFTSSSIGLGDEGITYNLKTFKTTDHLFIPYEKVNYATSTGSWYQRTRELFIFGEQNIIPSKRFKKEDAKRIIEELREKGVEKLEGRSFSESYHTSAWGILLCILTLSIWHWIVVAFTKNRKSIMIGDEALVWNGETWLIDFNKFKRYKPNEKIKIYAGKASDCRAFYYIKKHWYSLWGYVYIWAHPTNLRVLAWEAAQHSQDYDLEMGKVWFWNAKRIRKELEANGFKSDQNNNKLYKGWVKAVLIDNK